mmetsp:Transcript_26982/g.39947  ORF Transcript_26982/g.39947 Transcript_26982/m.39947 type:complete len:331 (+) Transcript_26982:99-1091(+)
MSSIGPSSISSSGFSIGTSENQSAMFKYIEGQKWVKLRKILARNAGKEQRTERDESGLSLLGMALGFEAPLDVIKAILEMDPAQAGSRDFYGATPLHVACLNGASLEAVLYLLGTKKELASTPDKDRRIPLHHAVECLCRNEIDFDQGLEIVNALINAHSQSIHHSDKHRDSPIDLVQLARIDTEPDSTDAKRLEKLYSVLRDMSVKVYKTKKLRWEAVGYTHKLKSTDHLSKGTASTQGCSVASSHVTNFTNRESVGGMDLSTLGGDFEDKPEPKKLAPRDKCSGIKLATILQLSIASDQSDTSSKKSPKTSQSEKKVKKNKFKFWKKT